MFCKKDISKQTLFQINDATRTQTKHNRDSSKTPNGALTSEPRGRDPHQISRARRVSSGHAAVAQPTDILKDPPPQARRDFRIVHARPNIHRPRPNYPPHARGRDTHLRNRLRTVTGEGGLRRAMREKGGWTRQGQIHTDLSMLCPSSCDQSGVGIRVVKAPPPLPRNHGGK